MWRLASGRVSSWNQEVTVLRAERADSGVCRWAATSLDPLSCESEMLMTKTWSEARRLGDGPASVQWVGGP